MPDVWNEELGEYQMVLDHSGKWRGRFFIEKDDDGLWQVIDDIEGRTLGFDTRSAAEEAATFARQYVRQWGYINFDSFPYSIEDEPVVEEWKR